MNTLFKKASSILGALIIVASCFIFPFTASAASVSDLRSKVVDIALGEEGYREYGDNETKYGEWYGYQGAWCTTFAIWCYDQADRQMGTNMYDNIVPSGGSSGSMRNYFVNQGRYQSRTSGYVPQKGDWVFTSDSSSESNVTHVALVTGSNSTHVFTIDGNVSNTVGQRKYSMSSSNLLGFGIPNYEKYGSGSSSDGGSSNDGSSNGGASNPQPSYGDDTAIKPYDARVNTDLLNVRKNPSASASKVATIKKDAVVTVTAKNGDWAKIENGYVMSEYLTAIPEEVAAANDNAKNVPAPAIISPESISVASSTSSDQLMIGDVVALNVAVLPVGAAGNIKFSTSSTAVSVDEKGNVTALAEGQGEISISIEGTSITQVYTFNVTAPTTSAPIAENTEPSSVAITQDEKTNAVEAIQGSAEDDNSGKKLAVTFIATGMSGVGLAYLVPTFLKKKKSSK